MGKKLVIAEKPSVARDIAKVLKCTKKGDGFIFSEDYIVSWAIGHLVTLCDPEDYDESLKSWKYQTLPILPEEIKLKPIKQTKAQLNILKKLMKDKEVDEIICATDSGREGELIFRYIYEIVKCKKPFKRLWISSMTDVSIKEGFSKLKDGSDYDNLYISARCRSESDWLVGINATRAYTLKYNALLSIGRVQTPTLFIIVEKQKEINAFVSKDFFEVKALFTKYNAMWFDKESNDTKILEKSKAEEISNKVLNKIGKVTNIEKEEKKQPPTLLYDLTELQRECNRKFGFSAKKTLTIAQDLYEKRKLITYPRTDSRYLSDDMKPKINATIKKLNIEPYTKYVEYLLELETLPITKRIIDNTKVTDHHAIIPTDTNINLKTLSADEFKVYDLIARKFLSVFYPYYIYNITRITTVVESENFLTKGNTIIQLGWMELYQNEKSEEKKEEEEELLPDVALNEEFEVTKVNILEKKTKPPKAYTEGTLLSAMENAGRFVEDEDLKEQLKQSGIGTAATRAAIIERILEVGYIERKGKVLFPTEKGMNLIEVVPNELKSPETTGKWEKGLNSISKGEMDYNRFMGSIFKYVNYLVNDAKNSKAEIVFKEENKYAKPRTEKAVGKCPSCTNGQIYENTKAFFCSEWKAGCKFSLWKNGLDKYANSITKEIATKLLTDKKVVGLKFVLPQTMEQCVGDLVFKEEKIGTIEIINLDRIKV